MRKLIAALVIACAVPALAETDRDSDDVLETLMLDPLLEILQDEAVEAGGELAREMMPERDLSGWAATLRRINDPDRVGGVIRTRFAEELDPSSVAPVLDYFGTEAGQRILSLELSAREALADPEIEEAVRARLDAARADDTPRAKALDAYIAVNDLIDANVLGALNSNAAFLSGLGGGAGRGPADETAIYQQVLAQEPEIRADTTAWVEAFVALAYQPLSMEDLTAHVEFAGTPAGQDLNAALFAAFNAAFVRSAGETGRALARLLDSSDL